MKDLRRNPEGYMDMTAYLALRELEEYGGRYMEQQKKEIWSFKAGNISKEVLVLNTFGNYAIGWLLVDDDFGGYVKTKSVGIKYIDPSRMTYVFDDNFLSYIRTVSEAEFAEIKKRTVEVMGLADVVKTVEIVKEVNCEKTVEHPQEIAETDIQIAVLRSERDIYIGLYEQLLKKVTA